MYPHSLFYCPPDNGIIATFGVQSLQVNPRAIGKKRIGWLEPIAPLFTWREHDWTESR